MRQLVRQFDRSRGFSLVELMVALVFTLVLMAGLATVFKHSLGVFVTSGERVSSSRRNRTASDMIYDDLNAAGMLLASLAEYGKITQEESRTLNSTTPAFQIIPNVAYTGADVTSPNNVADQLFLYYDDPFPFEGIQKVGGAGTSELVAGGASGEGAALPTALAFTFSFGDAQQASAVETEQAISPLVIISRTSAASPMKVKTLARSGSQISLTVDSSRAFGSSTDTTALFVKPGRYVRYSIQPKSLDPSNAAATIPCLVRDEQVYSNVAGSANPFAATVASSIVTDNVVGFQVMVSVDGGVSWANDPNDIAQRSGGAITAANPGISHTKWATWANISALLNANTALTGRPGPNNKVDDSKFWFKDIPVLVRVDITTRAALSRGEYLKNAPYTIMLGADGVPYKIQTQSVVIVPRHFGLSYNYNLL